jgi:hypothetical protein
VKVSLARKKFQIDFKFHTTNYGNCFQEFEKYVCKKIKIIAYHTTLFTITSKPVVRYVKGQRSEELECSLSSRDRIMKLTTHSSLEVLLPHYCPITAVVIILVVMKFFVTLTCLIQVMLFRTRINYFTTVLLLILHEISVYTSHSFEPNARSTSPTILPSVYL